MKLLYGSDAADPRNFPPRNYRNDQPIETHRTPVKLRGEKLSTLWWRGSQWAVTAFGIEALDGTYSIAANRLAENLRHHGWPAQITGKIWVDPADFCTAWLVAIALHGATIPAADVREAIQRSIVRAPPDA